MNLFKSILPKMGGAFKTATVLIFFTSLVSSMPANVDVELEKWLSKMESSSLDHILDNITPSYGLKGSFVPSSDRWPTTELYSVRDSALALNSLADIYAETAQGSKQEEIIRSKIKEHLTYLRDQVFYFYSDDEERLQPRIQSQYAINMHFYYHHELDPQNDATALQILSIIKLYRVFQKKGGKVDDVLNILHRKGNPKPTKGSELSLLQPHIEYVMLKCNQASFDIWEMEKGDHFWTRAIQRKALLEAFIFYQEIHDVDSHDMKSLLETALLLGESLKLHWSSSRKQIVESLEHGKDNAFAIKKKASGLDIATVLASLRGDIEGNVFGPESDKIQSTFFQLLEAMKSKFSINQDKLNVALGRYPEDLFDGQTYSEGNPWFLATLTASEYLFVLGQKWVQSGEIKITENNRPFLQWLTSESNIPAAGVSVKNEKDQAIFESILKGALNQGEMFLKVVKKHTGENGRLSEQFNKDTGFAQGPADYTWSYSALLEAARQRKAFMKLLK